MARCPPAGGGMIGTAPDWLRTAILVAEYGIVIYVLTINTIYFVMMLLGYFVLKHAHHPLTASERQSLVRSSLVPRVSVLVPAFNEEITICDSVKAILALNYPRIEVLVINDGSTDRTLSRLIDRFRLYRSSRRIYDAVESEEVRAIYESRDPIPVAVIDKPQGGKADALNAGLSASRGELVAVVDADSLLEPDALLSVLKPFLEDERTVAAGGIVRVVDGCTVRKGQIERVGAPTSILPLMQTVEYLRAFLGGRVAFSFMNSLLVISGAFGLFDRGALVSAGGFSKTTVGEDMEITVRLHRQRPGGERSRIVFVPDPVCWTEAPADLRTLYRQLNRWQRGTVESVLTHRSLFGDFRYGALGLFGFPYFTFFEMAGPAVELAGYVLTVVGFLMGVLSIEIAVLFFMVSVLFSITLSMGAVLLEEHTARRYPSPRDVLWLLLGAVLENLGYRQLMTAWRAKGLIDALAGKRGWGRMERRGFGAA